MRMFQHRKTATLGYAVFVLCAALFALTPAFSSPTAEATEAAGQPVELTFTFWGSAFEREAVELMVQSFNDSHPGIQVRGQHIRTPTRRRSAPWWPAARRRTWAT